MSASESKKIWFEITSNIGVGEKKKTLIENLQRSKNSIKKPSEDFTSNFFKTPC